MAKRKRKRYSEAMKTRVLAAAKAEGLTATDVKKKFGVRPVTYYSWRRKSGPGSAARGRRGRTAGGAGLDSALRQRVQARLRDILPKMVSSEVDSYLASYFGGARRGRPRKKK